MKKFVFLLIKLISVVLIGSAIGLEIWNVYARLNHSLIPALLSPVFWLDRLALGAHFLEGLIAAAFAPTRNKLSLRYGIYTFFVGTVGLWELFVPEQQPESRSL